MKKQLPKQDPINAFRRKTEAARRIGSNHQCACGERRPEALIKGTSPITCASCKRKQEGRKAIDAHHVFGRANDPTTTLLVPVNDHRAELSVAQQDWPQRTLRNPDGSPLLASAGRIRGFGDILDYLIPRALLCDANFLEELDAYLENKFGDKWWRDTPLDHFGPKG